MYDTAVRIVEKLQSYGHTTYLCGGFVRDKYLNRKYNDIDIVTSASPKAIKIIFSEKSKFVGESFGVVLLNVNNFTFEIATFRSESNYTDGRHPDYVKLDVTPEEDAYRRDFTINGIFYDPVEDRYIDYVNGLNACDYNMIGFIGDPADRIKEDHLRILRAIRFKIVLGFMFPSETEISIETHKELIRKIPYERIRMEFEKMFIYDPVQTIKTLNYYGLLQIILPEIYNLQFVPQNKEFHPEGNAYEHTLLVLENLKGEDFITLFSGLLHDVGKLNTKIKDGKITSHGHDKDGVEIAEKICKRFKLSNDDTEQILGCVKDHMIFFKIKGMKTSTIKKKICVSHYERLMKIIKADAKGRGGDYERDLTEFFEILEKKIGKAEYQLSLPEKIIKGRDLIDLGLPPSPIFGKILNTIYDIQLNKSYLTREELLDFTKKEIEKHV